MLGSGSARQQGRRPGRFHVCCGDGRAAWRCVAIVMTCVLMALVQMSYRRLAETERSVEAGDATAARLRRELAKLELKMNASERAWRRNVYNTQQEWAKRVVEAHHHEVELEVNLTARLRAAAAALRAEQERVAAEQERVAAEQARAAALREVAERNQTLLHEKIVNAERQFEKLQATSRVGYDYSPKKKNAWVFIASNVGVTNLSSVHTISQFEWMIWPALYSLRQTGTKADIVVLSTRVAGRHQVTDEHKKRLAALGATYMFVDEVFPDMPEEFAGDEAHDQVAQIACAGLIQYDVVAVPDLDVLFYGPGDVLDEAVFSMPHYTQAGDSAGEVNFGFVVMHPNMDDFHDMMRVYVAYRREKVASTGITSSYHGDTWRGLGGDPRWANGSFAMWNAALYPRPMAFPYSSETTQGWMYYYWHSVRKQFHYPPARDPPVVIYSREDFGTAWRSPLTGGHMIHFIGRDNPVQKPVREHGDQLVQLVRAGQVDINSLAWNVRMLPSYRKMSKSTDKGWSHLYGQSVSNFPVLKGTSQARSKLRDAAVTYAQRAFAAVYMAFQEGRYDIPDISVPNLVDSVPPTCHDCLCCCGVGGYEPCFPNAPELLYMIDNEYMIFSPAEPPWNGLPVTAYEISLVATPGLGGGGTSAAETVLIENLPPITKLTRKTPLPVEEGGVARFPHLSPPLEVSSFKAPTVAQKPTTDVRVALGSSQRDSERVIVKLPAGDTPLARVRWFRVWRMCFDALAERGSLYCVLRVRGRNAAGWGQPKSVELPQLASVRYPVPPQGHI